MKLNLSLRKIICCLLAALCLSGCLCCSAAEDGEAEALTAPAEATAEAFTGLNRKVNEYRAGQFPDVALADWYTPYVAKVYELGLMQGNTIGAFCPGGNVTVAETITIAARLHRIYASGKAEFDQTDTWYRIYVEYALANGIISGEYEDYNAPATRRQFAEILCNTFPESALSEINALKDGDIPDVLPEDEAGQAIYLLYRAGILTGNDNKGTFAPESNIRRSEVAAVVARMADPTLRKKLAVGPKLTLQTRQEDEFFADAAMLGNSLVDGMQLCAGISTMHYYGGTGLTVYNNRLSELVQKQFGRVYIQFGINEIGGTVDGFIEAYRKIVEKLQAAMPEAKIYLMAITPVTKARSDQGTFTMTRIGSFNEAIYALAENTGCYYVDTCNLLCDDSGYLPEKFGGWDGSPHLSTEGYVAWAEILRIYY